MVGDHRFKASAEVRRLTLLDFAAGKIFGSVVRHWMLPENNDVASMEDSSCRQHRDVMFTHQR
jgi:hypothetical protein